MSRCFPWYVRNGSIVEALIEPIKLQRGRTEIKEKAKTESKKEKRREKTEIKKEKKREKTEIKKEKREKRAEKKEERKQQKGKVDGGISDGKIIRCGGYLQKRIEDETEQLEKSGLTEEHGHPVCSPNRSYLSDSTQSSNKRKRDTSPSNRITRHGESGTILRIRLPLKKQRDQREPDTPLGKEQLCSTSGRTDSLAQQKKEIVHIQPPLKRRREPDTSLGEEQLCSTSGRADSLAQQKKEIVPVQLPLKKQRDTVSSLGKEQLCSTSGRADCVAQQKKEIVHVPSQEQCFSTKSVTNILAQGLTSRPAKESTLSVPGRIETSAQGSARTVIGRTSYKSEIQRTESLYKALIENFVPPPVEYVANDSDEEDWLFRPKQQDRDGSKRYKAGIDIPCFKSPTSLFPRAHYLSEVDVYALPYTVPF